MNGHPLGVVNCHYFFHINCYEGMSRKCGFCILWQHKMHELCHALTIVIALMLFGKVIHLQQLHQRFHVFVIKHGMFISKKVEDDIKLNIFTFMFIGIISQKLVKDKRLVMSSVCSFIFLHALTPCCNIKNLLEFQAFRTCIFYGQNVQANCLTLESRAFSPFHMGANLTPNLMHWALIIDDTFNPWQRGNPTSLIYFYFCFFI